MCVGFLYTLVARDPSSISCMLTSKKANCPNISNSLVNFIEVDIKILYLSLYHQKTRFKKVGKYCDILLDFDR